MNYRLILSAVCLLSVATSRCAGATNPADGQIQQLLRQHRDTQKGATGLAAGVVDVKGQKVFSYGTLDGNRQREVDGDTVFEIGSVSKVFTGLLLELMIERGEMKLDDPIHMYLPSSVKPPTFGGKEITLRHLVTHTAGLPRFPSNVVPRPGDDPFADYTAERLYTFLSAYPLPREPGTKFDYSNLGVGLLGHLISLKARTNYEALLVNWICASLKMPSTCVTLSPELKPRFASGHDPSGAPARNFNAPIFTGAGGIVSSVNDMLKFLAANLGLSQSPLMAAMKKTHEVQFDGQEHRLGMAWHYATNRGPGVLMHNGMTRGYHAFVALDPPRRRGVVVLSNSAQPVEAIGWRLLELNADTKLAPK